jgi:two-component system, response regulator PdtaR
VHEEGRQTGNAPDRRGSGDPARALTAGGRPARVLIVEDNAIAALDLSCIVTERGGAVVAQTSVPAEAVRLAERLRPDVVLMDVRLFGSMDGIDAAARIRKSCRVPVVFVTGNDDPQTLARIAELRAPVVVKPFTPDEIEAAIVGVLARRQARA